MPPLSRIAQPLLGKVGGKPSSADRPATTPSAAATPSPSSVPKPAPLPEGRSLTDDPASSSSNGESSDDDNDKIASSIPSSSVPSSPYKVPKGGTELWAQRFPGGRGTTTAAANRKRERRSDDAATTQDSAVGLDDAEVMGMFDARQAKRSKTTYGTGERSFVPSGGSRKVKKSAGYGGKSGAKSAHSTPAKNIHTVARTSAASTGRANKKGTPFSDVSANITTLSSSERFPEECAVGGGKEGRRPGKMLKHLEPIALSPRSRRAEPQARHVEISETRLPGGKPRVKILGGAETLAAARKENNAMIKKLPAINFPSQIRSPPKIMTLAPTQPPPSPADCTRRSISLSQSQDCETNDLTTSPKAITSGNNKSDASNKDGLDTPTKRKTIKTLPSIDNPKPKTTATRRSSRRNKGQAVDDSTHLPRTSSNGNGNVHDDDGSNIKVSSPVAGDFGDLDDDDDDDKPNPNGNYETPAKCPICQAPVDRILLEEWQGSRAYMRIRKQMAFCEAHRRATAQEEYAAREYPKIDFGALSPPASENGDGGAGDGGASGGGRIERFREDLVGIIRRERPSAFRDAADAAAARGEGRNLKTTAARDEALTGMSVGYYGPRGRRLMEAWVTRELADEIRETAGRDRLIGFKTVSGFIQEVLVPELAMRLVAEDLDVGEARAREVLRESGEIGELVNGVDDDGEGEGGGEKVVAGQPVGAAADDEDGGEY